jgi:hypothetical protein
MRTAARHINVAMLGACLVILLSGFSLSAQEGGTGYLKVKANTGRAGVFVDDKYLGPAANFRITRKYAVPAGEHDLTLRDPRYQDFSTKVKIDAGKTTTVSETLQPAPLASPPYGILRLQGGSRKYDAVYVNGKFMGHVGEFNNFVQGLLLNAGEYTLKVVSPSGSQELEQKIKIEENKTTRIHVGSGK